MKEKSEARLEFHCIQVMRLKSSKQFINAISITSSLINFVMSHSVDSAAPLRVSLTFLFYFPFINDLELWKNYSSLAAG
jgi:hypothetical protein